MPGCAAFGCNNRSEKGYSMKCFPRDPQLRKEWKKRVGRANWEPSKNSFLCHVHFEPEQWIQTANGKIRLKKDAMPSIFTETSTRKSPRKQRLENGQRTGNVSTSSNDNAVWVIAAKASDEESEDENYVLEYLDGCESNGGFASKGIEVSGGGGAAADGGSMAISLQELTAAIERRSHSIRRNNSELGYRIMTEKDMTGLEKENVIIVSDENNQEIGKLIHNNKNILIVADENNKEIGQIVVDNNMLNSQPSKFDMKRGMDIRKVDVPLVQDNYDEIEEKLKQICNGEEVVEAPATQRYSGAASFPPVIEILCKMDPGIPNEISPERALSNNDSDKEIPRNVQIIFGTESGDESRHASEINSPSNIQEFQIQPFNNIGKKNPLVKKENCADQSRHWDGKIVGSAIDDGVKKLSEGNGDNVTNIRSSALQQKRKTRERIMRTIERTIADLSEKKLRSIKNEQLTSSILRFARARKRRDNRKTGVIHPDSDRPLKVINRNVELINCESSSLPAKKSKFTIKVTGIAEDVSEIMEDLENISDQTTQERRNDANSSPLESARGDASPTDGRLIDSPEQVLDISNIKDEQLSNFGSVVSEEEFVVHDNNKKNENQARKNGRLDVQVEKSRKFDDDEASMWLKYFNDSKDLTRELKQKLNAQQEVIEKLTNQLIIYRELQTKLKSMNTELEDKEKQIKILKERLNERLQRPVQNCRTDIEIKQQQTISNLSNRVNELEEVNKKLIGRINLESQQKKTAYHLKQKDDKIKELNWKLEKASKFLDRAEKNANTYKRKMLSMQTSIRRQKATEEKQSQFKAMLIDNAKHEFSESTLCTAMDIKNSCGIKCYEKLLSCNFPLPSLRTLRRRFQKDNATEDDWGDEDQELVDTKDQTEMGELEICRTYEAEETEVTGTVQDIFEENNDVDDFNSSELGEHIFSQLERKGNT